MVDAGGPEDVVRPFLDQPALARDKRRGDCARLSADRARDPGRERVPGAVDQGRENQGSSGRARRLGLREPARNRADRADPAKVGVAGEIVAAGPRGFASRAGPASAAPAQPAGIASHATDFSAQRMGERRMMRRPMMRRGPVCTVRTEVRRGPMGRRIVSKTKVCR